MNDRLDLEGVFLPDDRTDPLLNDAMTPPPKAKPAPLPRSKKPFGKVNLSSLQDRRFDALFTPAGRLYYRLEIETRRGARPVRLTNSLAADVGIARQNKGRYLRELEGLGLVTVAERVGTKVPRVAVHPLPEEEVRNQPDYSTASG